jgi:hypothetical protein
MELLVFYPSDTRLKKRDFDGPVALGVQQAVGENPEPVPGFTSISQDGVIYPYAAYCDREAKRNGSPMNAWASALWHAALKREGYERGLRREDGTTADWLNGAHGYCENDRSINARCCKIVTPKDYCRASERADDWPLRFS